MKNFNWERFENLRGLLLPDRPEPVEQAERTVKMLRDVVLPAKVGLCVVILYYLFYSGWLADEQTARSVAMDTLKKFFLVYLLCNFVGGMLFIFWRRLPPGLIQWLAFILGLLDGMFMAGITVATGGFASVAFWVFPGLILLNALSIPLATPQIVLNLLLGVFYAGAVVVTPNIGWEDTLPDQQLLANMPMLRGTNQAIHPEMLAKLSRDARKSNTRDLLPAEEVASEQLLLRVSVLWLLTLCCYGAQLLQQRQRETLLEAAEFTAREAQLHSAGRLAAEFVHQIKNPLAIINNAAFLLERSVREGKSSAAQHIEIIREEVARADKVITQIMGYAQLSESRVEKLQLGEQIERALEQVFPAALPTEIKVKKRLAGPFPALLMQPGHLAEILVNLLLNGREALAGRGTLQIIARCVRDQVVEIVVADDGPGIPPDKLARIFEAYFTTKEKGTGLGLAIVKHNAELYGGAIRVESVLGKGAKFTVTLPLKSQTRPIAK